MICEGILAFFCGVLVLPWILPLPSRPPNSSPSIQNYACHCLSDSALTFPCHSVYLWWFLLVTIWLRSSQFNMSINFSKPAPLFYQKDVDGSTYLSESIYQLFRANFSLSSLSLTKRVSIKLTISSWSLPNLFDSAFKPNPPKLFFSLSSKELISAGFSWINFAIFCSFCWYPFRGTAKTGALECARSLHSNKDWSMQIPLK